MVCNNKGKQNLLLKSGLEERPPNHHQLPNQPLILAIAGVDHDLIIFSPSVITLLHTLRGGLCLIVVQLSLHSADSTLTSGKHLLLWGGLLAPAVSRWPTIVWVCAKVLLHRSSSTSSAYCQPIVPRWKSAASSLLHYSCDLRYCLPIALLTYPAYRQSAA